MLNIHPDEVLMLIGSNRALVKTVQADFYKNNNKFKPNDVNLDFIGKQLVNPGEFRPFKFPEIMTHPEFYFSPKHKTTSKHKKHTLPRGQKKPGAKFSKKESTTLLPEDGRMKLFNYKKKIVLVFDSQLCDIKEDFIFSSNANTNGLWWKRDVTAAGPTHTHMAMHATSIEEIIETNRRERAAKKVPRWNEIKAGLNMNGLKAIAAPEDLRQPRLNALRAKFYYEKMFEEAGYAVNLPLFVITKTAEARCYTPDQQIQDILAVMAESKLRRDNPAAASASPSTSGSTPAEADYVRANQRVQPLRVSQSRHFPLIFWLPSLKNIQHCCMT